MSDKPTYTVQTLNSMNSKFPWSGTISNIENNKNNKSLCLYATGDCDLNGRIYIALPSNTLITSDIKKKYNLML
jgi:hypothetical protein|tara:strand:- start:591 stop:812 length:222 start_codon:yes stop_codon:yes gene_type:complete